jgi:general secretion pathway protein J
MTRSRPNGFTLLEMLVALAIVGLLMTIVQQGLSFAVNTRERMLARSDAVQQLVLARELVTRQLERAQLIGWGQGEAKRLAFQAGPEVLRFVTPTPAYQAGPGWQLWELRLVDDGEARRLLLLRRAPLDYTQPGFEVLERVEPRRLATIAAPVQFAYFDPGAEGRKPGWLEKWSATDRLPRLVRLTDPTSNGAWPDLVMAVRAEVGPRCAADNGGEDIGCAG